MKRGQKSSRTQSRKLVKNKLQIGDPKLSMTVKGDQRAVGSQYADYNKINRSNVGYQNFLSDQLSSKVKRIPQVDGGKFKREIAAKKPRAAEIYGGRTKALEASYRKDKATGKRIEGSEYTPKRKRTERGGLKTTSKPRNKGLI